MEEEKKDVEKPIWGSNLIYNNPGRFGASLNTELQADNFLAQIEEAKAQPEEKKRRTIPKFTEEVLIGEKGLKLLSKGITKVKFKGKGHEISDLRRLMKFYREWTTAMYPMQPFNEMITKIEKFSGKFAVRDAMQKFRDKRDGIGEDDEAEPMNYDSDNDCPPPPQSENNGNAEENELLGPDPTDFLDSLGGSNNKNSAANKPVFGNKFVNIKSQSGQFGKSQKRPQFGNSQKKPQFGNSSQFGKKQFGAPQQPNDDDELAALLAEADVHLANQAKEEMDEDGMDFLHEIEAEERNRQTGN